ncbi:MAG TPA: glycosyltransferase [Terriglobales bacterium]|nr:glycosyltransferase [Terriglobales bacterium]
MNRFLMVAFHFPPQAGSSGQLRSLKLCRYLPEFGWKPSVLTAHPRAYDATDDRRLADIPPGTEIHRVFALDSRKHLAWKGRFLRFTALPDRAVTWVLGAIPKALSLIRSENLDLIYTTFPTSTAVLIGVILQKLTGKPWVSDLRDSITEDGYPRDPRVWRMWRWIEGQMVKRASRIIMTADQTRRMYLDRYPDLDPNRCVVILNGFDEEDFKDLPRSAPAADSRPLRLVHGGVLYPDQRDPLPFFRTLARLKSTGFITASQLSVELRAPGSEDYYLKAIQECDIGDIVRILPMLPYRESLRDAALADGLLVFQGQICNHQIPAKVYEYLRLRKPIFALTDHAGDTAALLRDNGGSTIVDIADEEAITREFPLFFQKLRSLSHPVPDPNLVSRYARRSQAQRMAEIFNQIKFGDMVHKASDRVTHSDAAVGASH